MLLSARNLLASLIFIASSAMSADVSINASDYPAAALKFADELAPELSESLKSCDVESAHAIHEKLYVFIYKHWDWVGNYEKLKPYQACFHMLRNISNTTQLVTNKYAHADPHNTAGPFDANYSACRKLADPSYDLKSASINPKWPERFGPEPSSTQCRSSHR